MKGILSIMVLVAVLFVSVQYAEAQEAHIFYGLENLFQDPDSVVKFYKSGGFSLKNYDMGFAMYAHPVDKTEMFKVTVLYDGKVSRFLIDSEPIEEETVIEEVTNSTGIIYPKSSIGTDITNWDIPTTNPRDIVRDPKIIVYLDPVSLIFINDEYTPHIKIQNQDYEKTAADMNLEITRDGRTIKSISESITNGVWYPIINILDDYYTPGFCYTISVTATSGNHTDTAQDDFTVISTAKYWSTETDPIDADSKCNK